MTFPFPCPSFISRPPILSYTLLPPVSQLAHCSVVFPTLHLSLFFLVSLAPFQFPSLYPYFLPCTVNEVGSLYEREHTECVFLSLGTSFNRMFFSSIQFFSVQFIVSFSFTDEKYYIVYMYVPLQTEWLQSRTQVTKSRGILRHYDNVN